MKNWKETPQKETVCYCIGIDKQSIVDAIQKGAETLKDIQQETKACTGSNCKTMNPSGKCCSGDIKELLRLYGNTTTDTDAESCCCCND